MTDPISNERLADQSAFPVLDSPDGSALYCREAGMTLRDWFAVQALNIALMECPRPTPRDSWQGGVLSSSSPAYKSEMAKWRSKLASAAYRFADALLEERSKP